MIVNTAGSEFVAEATRLLADHGSSSNQYLTGSLGGTARTLAAVADIVFQPRAGPFATTVHVVEFKFVSARFLPDVSVLGAARNLAALPSINPGIPLRYALATNAHLFPAGRGICSSQGVHVIEAVATAQDLAQRILEWAGVRYRG